MRTSTRKARTAECGGAAAVALVVIALMLAPNPSAAQWVPVELEGGTIFALAVDPTTPTTLYAGTRGWGIFKTTTGGAGWAAVNTGLTDLSVTALVVDPTTPSTVYAGTGSGVFKSTDAGANWVAASTGLTNLTVNALTLDPATPTTLYAGTSGDGVVVLRPDKVGAFRPSHGTFYLDANASGTWERCGTDRCLQIGLNGDIPLVGDWNGSGTFYLDYNGNGTWEGCGADRCLQIGMLNDTALVGDWNGFGTVKVGVFRPTDGTFYLDYDGSGTWDGCGTDRCLQIGMNEDSPLVGK